jgi:hypothetical protein
VAEALMSRGLSVLVLFAVLGGLLAYIFLVDAKRPPASERDQKDKVFALEADRIEELTVRSETGETTRLRKAEDGWQVVDPVGTPADESEVSGITSNLASLEIQRVVEEQPADLAQFGLESPRIAVAFKTAGDEPRRELLLGDRTATGGDMYARVADEDRVFLVAGYLDTTFNRSTFDLRDKTILRFDRDQIDAVEVATASSRVSLSKADVEWKMTHPWQARGDYGTVEGLLGRLHTGQMRNIVAQEADDLPQYGLDRPKATVTLTSASAQTTLLVGGEAEDGAVYARDLSRPMVFTIDASLAEDLEKPAVEYRRKDLFEFRPFNANRVDVTREGRTIVYERAAGEEEDTSERWRRLAPEAGDVDATQMDTALSRLSNLRAASFVESRARTGLDSPLATIVVHFDDRRRQERVMLGRAGDQTFAAREDEPGAAHVETRDFDDLFSALDRLEAPATDTEEAPEPPPPTD